MIADQNQEQEMSHESHGELPLASPAMTTADSEAEAWNHVKQIIGERSVTLGHHWSFNIRNDPKRLAFVLSRYKFAAKMACRGGHVLELGCSEGIGTPVLAEFVDGYLGVDLDADAIAAASRKFANESRRFQVADFLGMQFATPAGVAFDAVVSLDVVEHIMPDTEAVFFDTVAASLKPNGIAVVGTPNESSDVYASPMSKAGHVNLFDGPHLTEAMQRVFRNVFLFGINDEVVHTGFSPMCHYLVAVGCGRR